MRRILGHLIHNLRIPGLIKPFQYRDPNDGSIISIRTSPRYTILTVGGKELFFIRETGKFDGTGAMSEELPPATSDCVVNA